MSKTAFTLKSATLIGVLACLPASAATYANGVVTERIVIPEGETLTVTDPHDVTFAGGISMTNATLKIESTDETPVADPTVSPILAEDDSTAKLIAKGAYLCLVTNFTAQIAGSLLGSKIYDTVTCFVVREDQKVTCQFQYTNGSTLRCVIMEFTQVGDDIYARAIKRTYYSDKTKAAGEVDMNVTYTGTNSRSQIYLVNIFVSCRTTCQFGDDAVVLSGATDATNATLRVTGTAAAPKHLEIADAAAMPTSGEILVGAYGSLELNVPGVTQINGITKGTKISVAANGRLLVKQAYSLSAQDSYVTVDGGVMLMRPASSGDDSGGYAYDVTLKNGARLVGGAPRFRRRGSGAFIHACGISPSFIDTGLIVWSYDTTTPGTLTLDVENVTDDAEPDLTVAKSLRATATADYADVNVVKTGHGTVLLNGGWNLPRAPKLQAGTWLQGTSATTDVGLSLEGGSFAVAAGTTNEVGVLAVSASGGISVGANAKLSFAASGAEVWASDVLLSIEGDLTQDTLRFGTDANGLTRTQLNRMRVDGKKVMLDANGYLRERPVSGLMILFK